MQADLGVSPEDLSWVFNAYVVAFGVALLVLAGGLLRPKTGPALLLAQEQEARSEGVRRQGLEPRTR